MQIEGYVSPGFEPVADAFAENFTVRGDRGAACAVMIDGELVVDIHGGAATAGKPWNTATRSVVFSVSKGVTTICLLMAAERGLVDLDEPVATYWPEFGARGKDMVTVRELLSYEETTRARQQYLTMLRNRLERLEEQAVESSPLAPRGA